MHEVFHDWTPEYYAANESACKLYLNDVDLVKKITSLNAASLNNVRDGQIVRFRGMIQDIYNPEYYFERYEVKNCETCESAMRSGVYMDFAKCLNEDVESVEMDSQNNKLSERQSLVVISIPGLNEWAKEKESCCPEEIQNSSTSSTKRELGEEEMMDCSEPPRKKEKTENVDSNGKSNCTETKSSCLSREHIMNFPIPNNDGKACIVKVYNDEISYKINEIVDIVAFISLDPMLSQIHGSENANDDLEVLTHNPPASIVPRLHAIKIVSVKSEDSSLKSFRPILSKAESVRNDLLTIFRELLCGDELAANYLICHLISAVYVRKDILCLGNFPINISNVSLTKSKTFAEDFYEIIATLVPKSHYIELTLEGLNEMSLIPKKDYDCNRLTSGILQLSENTHLVINETRLQPGQVTPSGRQNYEAITDLIQSQKISYDFKFFKKEYETDIPVLIISEVKSFIPCGIQIPLRMDPSMQDNKPDFVEIKDRYFRDEERLRNIREYLLASRNAKFHFEDAPSSVIHEDFVSLRQRDKNFTADNLHNLMVLARLVSLSRGQDTLSVDCWRETVSMELERFHRLPERKR